MYTVAKYILFFFIYSLLGVVAEVIFGLIVDHRINDVAHDFLFFPIMFIYGFGAGFILLLHRFLRHPFVLFIGSVLITSLLEFVAHWLLQTIFGVQFWNYSDKPFNLWGRVSLDSSLAFGVATLLFIYGIHPQVSRLLKIIPKQLLLVLAGIASTIILIEAIHAIVQLIA